jgi:hypothetical protein
MVHLKKILPFLAALLLGPCISTAQIKRPTETRNAALRYWLAFGEMQDPSADPDLSALLKRTAAGEIHWDESKLGAILDKNESAVLRMQRATKLPECDWGLEYTDGPTASIAYAPKARVMASLNTLYGMRQSAKGDEQAAVQTWLAGIRFSQDIAKGGPLIFAIIGKLSLVPDLHAITQTVQSGRLTKGQRQQIAQVVGTLPESGFDWSSAEALEEGDIELMLDEGKNRWQNPANAYAAIRGKDAPPDLAFPTTSERAAFHKFALRVAEAFQLSPEQTQTKLPALQQTLKSLNLFYTELVPSLSRANDARLEIAAARQQLLQSVRAK